MSNVETYMEGMRGRLISIESMIGFALAVQAYVVATCRGYLSEWTCSYCDRMNEPGLSCRSCGAPRDVVP